jgi:SAM-dependent methyltransferase
VSDGEQERKMTANTVRGTVDERAVGAFAERVMADCAGGLTLLLAALGDRHGLFRALAEGGPATSEELAVRAGIDERYGREWLAAMASAGYLIRDPGSGRFELPAAHVPVLALDDTPTSLGGPLQWLLGVLPTLSAVSEALRTGNGVPPYKYGPDLWPAIERLGAPMYLNALVPAWLAAMPEMRQALTDGAEVADVGAGAGRALIALAQAFPRGRYTGFDAFAPQVERARSNAEQAGLADQVRFEVRDAAAGLPGSYDVVLAFDVLHDAADPVELLRSARQALRPGGAVVVLELAGADGPPDGPNPLGAVYYAVSLLYCLPTSLAAGGPGLGSLGLPQPKLAELAGEAGFGTVRRVLDSPPAHVVYELRP